MQYGFGSGTLTGVRSDIANSTPAIFGVVQDAEINFDFSLKELIGQYQAPVAIARAALKSTLKVKSARIYSKIYNDLFFGQTAVAGGVLSAINEAGTVPAPSGPYTITVTGSANFVADQGVFYAATGVQLSRVASGPATGQYSVTAGVYTFASGDASTAMLLNYTYTTSTGATKLVIANQLQGAGPSFQVNLAETYQSKVCNIQLNYCVASKLSFPFKNQDFTINDWEAMAGADAAGNVGIITVTE